ncbi:DUF5000 domain-containing lipoprotein [Parapedobacter pyrenivorans]|uniref:DUF5000 domain-containing lipoprotein n=1 Tax=Parapedobacter pyrenivorans TaxID=1305674 RepID=UPI00333F8455
MKRINLVLFSVLILWSCAEKDLEPISSSLGKPGVITDVSVEATPGGAIVTYRIPNSEDILGVKAVYTISNGSKQEVSSSFYDNKIAIVGFDDMLEHTADVYVFNRALELSDPVKVTFTPLESPLSKVRKSMNIVNDFGGAQFQWSNELKAPVVFEFLAADSTGQMVTSRIASSEAETMMQSIRGFAPEPRKFAVIVSDQFGNYTDTITETIVPLFEEEIPKTGMSIMKLGSDASFTNWEGMDNFLIDNDRDNFGHSANSSIPAPFTIDLGVEAKLSRVVMFQRFFSGLYYNWGNPKEFEVYVSATKPAQNGDWAGWTKIMDCEIIKPSGLPITNSSDEDIALAQEGHEFAFPLDLPPARYIRINILSTWGGTTFTHPAEIDVFGEVQ